MADCIYCGQPAGFLRKSHKDCEQAFKEGKNKIISMIRTSIGECTPLSELEQKMRSIAKASFIPSGDFHSIILQGWETAVERSFDDGLISDKEEDFLDSVASHFGLGRDDLDKNGYLSKLVKGAVLRDLCNGVTPKRVTVQGPIPFNFQKDEQLIWLFQGVDYYETKTRREYVGGYSGVSIRIAKGLYYRTGGFRGRPVERSEMIHADKGLFAVTNRHVYFSGGAKNFRIRYNKIVSFTPYSDGIGLQRDTARAKPEIFVTGDGWFTYNLLTNVSRL